MSSTSLPFVPTEGEQDGIRHACSCGGFDPGNGKWGHRAGCPALGVIEAFSQAADVRRRITDQPEPVADVGPRPASLRSIFGSFFLMWLLSWLLFHGIERLLTLLAGPR